MSCGTVSCHHDNPAEKEVTSSRYRFPKPVHHYGLLLYFGSNIVASDGEEWKRFRKIAAPAFSDVRHLSNVT
jgi:cytochrome P450